MSLKGAEMSRSDYLEIKVSLLEKEAAMREQCCKKYAMQRNISILLCVAVCAVALLFAFRPAPKEAEQTVAPTERDSTISFAEWTQQQNSEYIASASGEKYHKRDCDYVGNILKENRVYYETAAEAERNGKDPCALCRPNK